MSKQLMYLLWYGEMSGSALLMDNFAQQKYIIFFNYRFRRYFASIFCCLSSEKWKSNQPSYRTDFSSNGASRQHTRKGTSSQCMNNRFEMNGRINSQKLREPLALRGQNGCNKLTTEVDSTSLLERRGSLCQEDLMS